MGARRLALVLGLLLAGLANDARADPAWSRSPLTPLLEGQCQELVIDARGEGPLEVRFPLLGLEPNGPDVRGSGASLWIPADPGLPTTLTSLHPAALPTAAHTFRGPIRFTRRGSRVCVGSGGDPVACVRMRSPPAGSQRIALGPKWETRLRGCPDWAAPMPSHSLGGVIALLGLVAAGAALAKPPRGRSLSWLLLLVPPWMAAALAWIPGVWTDPRVPGAAVAGSAAVLCAALAFRRSRVALAAAVVAVWASMAPVALEWVAGDRRSAPERGAVPEAAALWTDPAFWNPFAAHHSLSFRSRSVADAIADPAETWIVVGGSVTQGIGVAPDETFAAVAEARLRASGRDVRVLNAGVPAWTLGHADRLLQELDPALDPDGVVVVSILNSAGFSLPGPRPDGCDGATLRALLCGLSRGPAHLAFFKYLLPEPGNRERFRTTLRGLLERESAAGRGLVLLDESSQWQLEDSWRDAPDERFREVAREEAARFGLLLHPVGDALASVAEEERFLDAIHLAPAGHRAVGRRLAELLADQPIR